MFEPLVMLPSGCSFCQESSRSLFSSLLAVVLPYILQWSGIHITQCVNAVVELKLIPAAINQSTQIEYSPFTDEPRGRYRSRPHQ